MSVRRLALVVGVFGLIAVLLTRNTPSATRRAAVAESLRNGSLGRLAPEERARLDRIIALVREAAKIPMVVNPPVRGSDLPIYTVLPATERLTRCAAGNAVYDAQLDAVFLHTSLVRIDVLAESRDSAWEATLTFEDFYLALILLHEIGHRRLHRGTYGAFDDVAATDERNIRHEREADAYAVAAFAAVPPSAIRSFVGEDRAYPLHWFDVDVETLPERELALANLAASVRLMTYIASAWESPHAAISPHRTHPTMPERAMRIIDAALRRTDGTIARELRLAKEDVHRFQATVASNATLFTAREAIKDVSTNGTDFTVRDAAGNIYAVDPRRGQAPPGRPRIHGPGTVVAEWWPGMWGSSPATMHAVDRDGHIWSVRGDRWVRDEPSSGESALRRRGRLTVLDDGVRASNRGEAALIYLVQPDAFSSSERRLVITRGPQVIDVGSVPELLSRATGTHRTQTETRLIAFEDDTAFLSIWSDETLDGVLAVDAPPQNGVQFYPMGVRSLNRRASRLIVQRRGRTPTFYVVATYRADRPRVTPHGLYVFRIAGSQLICVLGGAIALAEFTPGGRGFEATAAEEPYFEIADVQQTTAGTIVVALDADSVYELALSRLVVRRIFHPGRVALAPARSTLFIYHQKDSRRGYILRMHHNGRQM
jgi:hypothetical protein